ncbi:MAG: IPT/TIG domain-containing protein [Solirubrobacterales bacterium]
MRVRCLLALAPALLLVLVLAPLAEAGNTVWVGVTGEKGFQERFSGECIGVSPRLAHTRETVGQIGPPESAFEIVDDGVIKAWTALGYTQAADNDPASDPPDAYVRFDLLRPFASRHPTKIAESQAATYLDGITSNSFTQAVEAGDGIGVDLESNPTNEESEAWIGCTAGSATAFGANNVLWSPPLVSNSGPAGEPEETADPDYLLELGAEVEYDAPVITGISPATGPLNGENKVTITGEHLKYSNVHVGEYDAGKYEDTDTTAVIRVPAGRAEGPVDVVLKTAGGTATLVDGYTYGPKETHEETQKEKEEREQEERIEEEEECEELEEEGKSCESTGGSGGGGSGGGAETKPAETPVQPNPGPSPSPTPSESKSGAARFKLPKVKVAKAGGALSLAPSAPSAGVFHAEGVVVVPTGNPRAAHTRSIVYGSATAHAKAKGPVTLKLAPSAAAKALLAKGHSLKIHLTVTFTAKSGGKTAHATVVMVGA